MEYLLGQLFGALIPTLAISRVVYWIGRKVRKGPYPDILLTHAIAFAICFTIPAFTYAQNGSPQWAAGFVYLLPQLFWLIVDLVRKTKNKPPFLMLSEQEADQ